MKRDVERGSNSYGRRHDGGCRYTTRGVVMGSAGKRTTDLQARFVGRTTRQRSLILDVIGMAGGHLDADEIYRLVRQRAPGVSLSTVYRTLQVLKRQGLAKEHQFDGVRRSYEMMPASQHHHLVCQGCGRVFEFTCGLTEMMKTRLSREKGFRVTEVDVRFTGLCPECQRRLKDVSENEQLAEAGRS